jgi:hypothetical protein
MSLLGQPVYCDSDLGRMGYTLPPMPVALSLQDRSLRFARLIGLGVSALSGVVLLGWVFRIDSLIQPLPTVAGMKVNTAVLLALEGFALALITSGATDRRVGRSVAALGATIAALTLSQDMLQVDLGIDQLLFHDYSQLWGWPAGRMAPATALSLLLLGLGMAAPPSLRGQMFGQVAALLTAAVALLAIVGYLLDVRSFYGFGAFTTMAVHTAALLFNLATGVIASQPRVGVARLLLGEGPASVMARYWIPVATFAPAVAAVLVFRGQTALGFSVSTSLAIFAVFTTAMLCVVITFNAAALRRLQGASEEVEDQFNVLSATLERRIEESRRTSDQNPT